MGWGTPPSPQMRNVSPSKASHSSRQTHADVSQQSAKSVGWLVAHHDAIGGCEGGELL